MRAACLVIPLRETTFTLIDKPLIFLLRLSRQGLSRRLTVR
jgi:hypothetical protein